MELTGSRGGGEVTLAKSQAPLIKKSWGKGRKRSASKKTSTNYHAGAVWAQMRCMNQNQKREGGGERKKEKERASTMKSLQTFFTTGDKVGLPEVITKAADT